MTQPELEGPKEERLRQRFLTERLRDGNVIGPQSQTVHLDVDKSEGDFRFTTKDWKRLQTCRT